MIFLCLILMTVVFFTIFGAIAIDLFHPAFPFWCYFLWHLALLQTFLNIVLCASHWFLMPLLVNVIIWPYLPKPASLILLMFWFLHVYFSLLLLETSDFHSNEISTSSSSVNWFKSNWEFKLLSETITAVVCSAHWKCLETSHLAVTVRSNVLG